MATSGLMYRNTPTLGKRYTYDGKSVRHLNELQIAAKKRVEWKISSGLYNFECVPCALCGKDGFELLSSKDRYGLHFNVVICRCCGLIQANPRMTQKAYTDFYNLEYRELYTGKDYSNIQNYFDGQWKRGSRIYSFIEEHGKLKKPLSKSFVFEVGCGAGGILLYFREKGCQVSGVDLGEEYLNFGKEKYGLDLYNGNITAVSLNEKPDVIIYNHALEHILNPNEELEYIYRILAPHGILYIAVPGVKNLMNSYGRDFLQSLQNAHAYTFSLNTLAGLLSKKGFSLIEGDEVIQSIFSLRTNNVGRIITANDYDNAIAYLLWAKKKFFYKNIKDFIKKASQALGVYWLVRALVPRVLVNGN